MLRFIENKIRKAFSGAAMQYDILTSLHKEIGRDLSKRITKRPTSGRLLDIGMGTGWLTGRLTHYFPGVKVIGIDFAQGMLEKARKEEEPFEVVLANALAIPFQDDSFDVVVSNLAFQWISDLPKAFGECRRVLKPEGQLAISLFGRSTFQELFVSLEHAAKTSGQTEALKIARLASRGEIERSLAASGLKNVKTEFETIKVHFPDMFSLIQWIKKIGANRLPRQFFVGKDFLNTANHYYTTYYKDKFGVTATFEIVWITANK